MSILLPKPLTRRSAMRGMLGSTAIAVGMPFLDCFLNNSGTALAATGAPIPTRFGTWYWGMGHTPGHAVVEKRQTQMGIDFLEECEALNAIKHKVNYFGTFGMPHDGRSNYTHWSGWVANRTGTAPMRVNEIPTVTLDLIVADHIGAGSRFKTLDASAIGIARENYSARNTDSRGAADPSPVSLYARVFGPDFMDPNKADFKPNVEVMLRKSVLSAFNDSNKEYIKNLGAADKARLDEYFTSIREIENQLAHQLEKPAANEACLVPPAPKNPDVDGVSNVREVPVVTETHKVMAKLMAMAVACNQTKVFNMVFTDNFATWRKKGETYTHHLVTHEELVDEKLGYQPIAFYFNKACMDGWATYLQTFDAIKEGDGTLLDNCLIFASSETNYARLHTIDGVPVYLGGKAGGKMKSGMHVVGGGDPITRVGFTAMKLMGVPLEKWGTASLQTPKVISDIYA